MKEMREDEIRNMNEPRKLKNTDGKDIFKNFYNRRREL